MTIPEIEDAIANLERIHGSEPVRTKTLLAAYRELLEEKRTLANIGATALTGLQTDGAHHKQWFLACIFSAHQNVSIGELERQGLEVGIAP
jgi:hypothetical protein